MKNISAMLLISMAIALGIIVINFSMFKVQQGQYALITRFGQLQRNYQEAGIYFKLPFLEEVLITDQRNNLSFDKNQNLIVNNKGEEILVRNSFEWKVKDPIKYYKEANFQSAQIHRILQNEFNQEFSKLVKNISISELLIQNIEDYEEKIKDSMSLKASNIGVEIQKVSINQIDLDEATTKAIIKEMEDEIKQRIKNLEAQVKEHLKNTNQKIQFNKDLLINKANAEASEIKTQADIKAISQLQTLAEQDKELFDFWYTSKAYEEIFSKKDYVVFDLSSSFFKYLKGLDEDKK